MHFHAYLVVGNPQTHQEVKNKYTKAQVYCRFVLGFLLCHFYRLTDKEDNHVNT